MTAWTKERIARLGKSDVKNLRENAQRLGNSEVARLCELRLYELRGGQINKKSKITPQSKSETDVNDLFAQGIAALEARGYRLSRTIQMLNRHGAVVATERIVTSSGESINFKRMREAGLTHLTAEAIVLKHSKLFSEKAIHIARSRLGDFEVS